MRAIIPAVIARETAMLQAEPSSVRRTDRLTPPASPALSTTTTGLDDHRSVLSSDSMHHLQNLVNDTNSLYSISTAGHTSDVSYDMPQYNGSQPSMHPMEHVISLAEPLIVDDTELFAQATAMFGSMAPLTDNVQTNAVENSSYPIASTSGTNHGRHMSASETMADMFEQIDEQLDQQNLRPSSHRFDTDSDISSDGDADQETPRKQKLYRHPTVTHSMDFPTVGFHNGRGADNVSHSNHNANAGSYMGHTADHLTTDHHHLQGSPMSPTSDVFTLETTSRANSISRAGTIVTRRSDGTERNELSEVHQYHSHEHVRDHSQDYGLEADFNNLNIRRTSSITTHVLSPLEPITLSLQNSNDVVYKPDENDGIEDAASMHKPDAVISSARSIISVTSSTSSKATSEDSGSHPLKPGKFFSFKKSNKTVKVEGGSLKVSTSPPTSSTTKRKQSKTLHSASPYGSGSHYKPFGSIIAPGGGKKTEVSKSHGHHSSHTHLPTAPVAPKVTMPKTRNSISDDEISSDEPTHPYGASVLDHREPLADHRASIATKPLPIPKSDPPSNWSPPLPTSSVTRTMSNHGSIVYSTSPASISGMSRPNASPNSVSESYDQDRTVPMQRVGTRVEKLRRHAQTNLNCIKYMNFVDMVSFATDLFVSMRKLENERDYENAYIHGMQGMM